MKVTFEINEAHEWRIWINGILKGKGTVDDKRMFEPHKRARHKISGKLTSISESGRVINPQWSRDHRKAFYVTDPEQWETVFDTPEETALSALKYSVQYAEVNQ